MNGSPKRSEEEGGEGFNAQWDPALRLAYGMFWRCLKTDHRDLEKIQFALMHNFNGDAFQRVIYTESRDDVANSKTRVPEEIAPGDAQGWFAKSDRYWVLYWFLRQRVIPMIFQGQEFVEGGWFDDTTPLDWSNFPDFKGIARLYRDWIRLRRNMKG